MNSKENTQKIIKAVQNLPTLPHVAAKINQLINSANFNVGELAKIIELDQSIAAKVLSLANSAFYGLPRKIASIHDAVIYIGTNTISQLVVSLGIINTFKQTGYKNFDRRAFWLHSIGVAMIAKEIARQDRRHDHPDDIFTAGLLHDIGKVALDCFCTDVFTEVLEALETQNLSFYKVEQQVIGVDHSRVGEWVARNWELPLFIIVAIRHHHELPEQRKGFSLSHDTVVDIVSVADWACQFKGIGHSGNKVIEEPHISVFQRVPVTQDEVLAHADAIKDSVLEAAALLGVEA